MNRYHFNIRINIKDNNAGSKATEDCRTILVKNGYKDLEVSFIKVWYLMPLNLLKLLLSFVWYFFTVRSRSLIVVQYPLLGVNAYFKYYVSLLKMKRCMFACIIHDLDSLRSVPGENPVKSELEKLAAYDAVISHNPAMSNWLKTNGYKGHIEEILLFDYLLPASPPEIPRSKSNKGAIAFAGNLGRGTFIKKLASDRHSFPLHLYGPGFKEEILPKNNTRIHWYGSFSPEQVVEELKGDFGLIWDGDSIDEITGLMGNYIRYNTPHKTSLYLAAGLPVIISKSAAIAAFVEMNQIGFCIDSLADIAGRTATIDEELYNNMRKNAWSTGKALRQGDYLKNAVIKTEEYLFS